MFDSRRITLFCLEKRLSKHKMAMFSKNLGVAMGHLAPPGYAYGFHGIEEAENYWRLNA